MAAAMSLVLASPPRKKEAPDDFYLMNAPSDLVCPLTLSPFIDPVITCSGHVYERAAIQAHMEHSNTDPLTRQPLLNKSLTPVYVLRSRALEYRETVAKACIERVCSGSGTPEPMRYLRRAVELIADTGSHVQGLSQETIEYVLAHTSNAFDRIALQLFAQGLFNSGYKDRAAVIYGSLLLQDADRMQQADLLRRCLSCWTEDASASASSLDSLDGNSQGYVFQKLVALFEGRTSCGMSWDQLVDLAQHAKLGDQFVLRLCEQLLFRPLSSSGCNTGSGSGSSAVLDDPAATEKRLLLKYVHVLTESLQRRQTESERRLQELDRWKRHRGGGGGGAGNRSSNSLYDDALSGGRGPILSGWMRHPALLASCMFLVAALPPEHTAARLLRAVPFLALLTPPSR